MELNKEAILNYITFLWVYFSMVSIKYNIEKQSRKEFISQKERMKLHNLMENVANSYTLMIKYDKSQDQIRMETCNTLFLKKYDIHDDKEIRMFLRNVTYHTIVTF